MNNQEFLSLLETTPIIIPARKGSKGVPKKNQLLLEHTLGRIPTKYLSNVIVSTDDEVIAARALREYPGCRVHDRSASSASDTACIKSCIEEVIAEFSLTKNIIMLYLTYPEREWEEVQNAFKWYLEKGLNSMLCREEVAGMHPYLYLYELENNKGRPLVDHDLCRRQDYPVCFKLCHYVSIFKTSEVESLNNNMYNENTGFYKISRALDIDTTGDLKRLTKGTQDD